MLLRLQVALETAIWESVEDAHRRHSDEQFYAYVIFTSPLFDYAAFLFNTEEGLRALADDEQERAKLRWRPTEWKDHSERRDSFDRVNEILGKHIERCGHGAYAQRQSAFVSAIKRLDTNGIFSAYQTRDAVLVNIMWGDEDVVAFVESARDLNPFPTYCRYARRQVGGLKDTEKEIESSRSRYKESALARIRRVIGQVERDLTK